MKPVTDLPISHSFRRQPQRPLAGEGGIRGEKVSDHLVRPPPSPLPTSRDDEKGAKSDKGLEEEATATVPAVMETKLLLDHDDGRHRLRRELPTIASRLVPCLCFEIGHFSHRTQFFLLSFLVFFFYIVYGYVQEWIFRQEGMKPHGWYLTLVQFAFYSLFSKGELLFQRQSRRIPLSTYTFLALTTLVTMGFSNASLGYLNYPTQVIFKCCKLIPVLAGGIVIQAKRHSVFEFAAAGLMSLGLICFTLADSRVSPNFDMTGVGMISVALAADAVIGNVQEKKMKQHNVTANAEVIYYSYGIGLIYLLLVLAATGKLGEGAAFFAHQPRQTYGSAFVFSLSGYLGMQAVLSLVKQFGAFVAVTVTSFRKVISIVISFVIFSKPFTAQYIYSGLLVLLGIYLNVLGKNMREMDVRAILMKFLNSLNRLPKTRRSALATVV